VQDDKASPTAASALSLVNGFIYDVEREAKVAK
jgi:hypothetical protein